MVYAFCCVMAGLVGRSAEQGGFIVRRRKPEDDRAACDGSHSSFCMGVTTSLYGCANSKNRRRDTAPVLPICDSSSAIRSKP
jgi:hypothetical protein